MKFRKKPIAIEAFEWTGRNVEELSKWAARVDLASKKARRVDLAHETLLPIDVISRGDGSFDLEIRTLEGTHKASDGDWIIQGVQGEFYPCKPDIFAATYEAVSE